MVTLSIVLPTYNRSFMLETFIKSLIKQSYTNWELIIIDDASKDNTFQIAAKYTDDERVRLYRSANHKGLPATRNLGVSLSRGDLIFFGEDDIIFQNKDALKILIDTYFKLKKEHEVGAVGPRLIDAGYKWLNDVVRIGHVTGWTYHNFGYDPGKIIEVPFLHACSLIPKTIFKIVGGFDEKLYLGTHAREEVDFYYRIRSKGYKLFFQPKSVLWHRHIACGGCEKNSMLKTLYYEYRNSMLFYARFYGILQSYRLLLHPLLRAMFHETPL
ncbi:MAG: glycosyltransferase [Candidatus Bathyarchaeia archaeon]